MSEVDNEFGGGTTNLLILTTLTNINTSIINTAHKTVNILVHGFNKLIVRVEQFTRQFENFMRMYTVVQGRNLDALNNMLRQLNFEHNRFAEAYRRLIENVIGSLTETPEEAPGGAKASMSSFNKTIKMLALRQVLKGLQALKKFITKIIDVAKSPITEVFSETLGRLLKIIKLILKPLEPFFFLLELIGTVISAALTPLTIYIWEEFKDIFDELIDMIPDLQLLVLDWIENDEDLKNTIHDIIDGVLGLIDAFITGDLLKKIYDMSVSLLSLAGSLVKADEDGVTLIERFINLSAALIRLAEALLPLMPILNWIIDALTGLANFFGDIVTGWEDFWGQVATNPIFTPGGPNPYIGFAEGGEVPYTGLIYAHQGETIRKKGIDDEMLRELEQLNYNIKKLVQYKEEETR